MRESNQLTLRLLSQRQHLLLPSQVVGPLVEALAALIVHVHKIDDGLEIAGNATATELADDARS